MARIKALIFSLVKIVRSRWKLLCLVAIVVIVGVGLFIRNRNNSETPVTYIKPETRDLVKTLEVSGLIDAQEKASLRFAAGGKLTYLGTKEGDAVRKGQTIATIDQRELQQRLQQDLNTYVQQRLDWEQTVDDDQSEVLTTKNRRNTQKSQLDLSNSVLNVEIRDTAIRNTRLSAPFDGILVSQPTTTAGVNLVATDVFEIINPETLVFKAAVDEADIAQVKVGQTAQITLDAYPEATFEATISSISLKSQSTSAGTIFVVRLPLTSDPLLTRYRLGMNGDVTIVLETKNNVLSVPLDATKQRDNKNYVDVKDGEVNVEREITIGLETDEYVEILSGVTANDEIVLPETGETK